MSQSAFIKRRCIHENFLHVRNILHSLHRKKIPGLFIKLDISKAFDSVSWPFLLEVLTALGFGHRFRSWLCSLFAMTNSKVLLNGRPGKSFRHRRGLRQGDPLSPMLFILAIDPLQKLLIRAAEAGLLMPIKAKNGVYRISLYADDAAIFANPNIDEMRTIARVLRVFGDASGLLVNLEKTEIFPIQCQANDLQECLIHFPAKLGSFPCTYLGLPLHFRKLRKIELQPLIDKVGAKLQPWVGRNFARAGRVVLTRSVLTAVGIFHMSVLHLPKWARKKIDKMRRAFIWKGDDGEHACGGHSLVNWDMVCRPKEFGGLGVLDLNKFGRALLLRWPSINWTAPDRPWAGSKLPCNEKDLALFRAATTITLGNGIKASFWFDRWLDGRAPKDIAPSIFLLARRKRGTVMNEIRDNCWIRSLRAITTTLQIREYITLWSLLQDIHLTSAVDDAIVWNASASGSYSASSAYQLQFAGATAPFLAKKVWNAKVEPKCKLFMWLLLHRKALTADRLAIRGWPHDEVCKLCLTGYVTNEHLARGCLFTRGVWGIVSSWLNIHHGPWDGAYFLLS